MIQDGGAPRNLETWRRHSPKEGIEGDHKKERLEELLISSCSVLDMYRLYRSKRKGDGREEQLEKC